MIVFHGTMFSQEIDHTNGGHFFKKIEYNMIARGTTGSHNCYNLEGKSILDRIFFGVTNSPVEFVLRTSCEGASAFRIVQNPSDSTYLLEVMCLPDSEELSKIEKILSAKVHQILLPGKLLNSTSLTLDDMEKIKEHNKEANFFSNRDDLYKPYRPESALFKISRELAEKMHSKVGMLINDFRAEGIPPAIADGYMVTFRCVVKDELWTLNIHMPQKKALFLSDICKQMIIDSKIKKFDEAKYLASLEQINSFGAYNENM